MSEEEAVALVQRIGERELGRRAIERAGQQAASSVGHVDHERAVAARRVLRTHEHEVAAEPDAAVGTARRAFEVGDPPVVFQRRIDGVVQPRADQIERAGVAELLALGVGTLLQDFDSLDGHGWPRFPTDCRLRLEPVRSRPDREGLSWEVGGFCAWVGGGLGVGRCFFEPVGWICRCGLRIVVGDVRKSPDFARWVWLDSAQAR